MPILPKSDNADYRGSILSAYAVALVGLLWIVPGAIHAFLPDGGSEVIAGLNLGQDRGLIISLFAWAGATQMVWGLMLLAIALRYRTLVPLALLFILLEYAIIGSKIWFFKDVSENMNRYAMKQTIPVLLAIFFLTLPFSAQAKLVEYEFDIDYKTVNFSGEEKRAMSVGGSIPAPTIEATVGDTLRVTFHNKMDVESSIHWHGILLPNEQDGVPYLTTSPIKAGTSFTFEYPIIHHGTYWYHSHTGLQEQRGVYGALVFHPKDGERYKADVEKVLVLSDWTDENPNDVLRNLKREDDYYAIKKDSVQSWDKVIANGWPAIKNRVNGSWTRMGPMDISDVGYDAFLINGKREAALGGVKGGQKLRLRIINASASSYQYVEFAGGPMTIVAADGVDVQPKEVDRLKLAIAETYDVLITVPDDNMAWEFRATSEDVTGYASVWLGDGHKMPARDVPKPNPFLVDHSMHGMGDMGGMEDMDHSQMDHSKMGHAMPVANSEVRMMQEYQGLKAVEKTAYDPARKLREVPLRLTGNMETYVWSFNGKTLAEADKILIRKGETVRFTFQNETMMHHPLHLHGHFFRVLNGEGDYSPLKHTVNVPPMQNVTIEFAADEEKDWFFHCHNLYHMESGMARVIRYDGTAENEAFDNFVAANFDPWYAFGEVAVQSNMANGELWAENINNEVMIEFDNDYDRRYEVEAIYERRLTRFLGVYIGGKSEREEEDEKPENTAIAGFHYVFPLLIESDLRINHEGEVRFGLESDLQLTDRMNFAWEWNTDEEYRLGLTYEITKQVNFVANVDSDYDAGAGIRINF